MRFYILTFVFCSNDMLLLYLCAITPLTMELVSYSVSICRLALTMLPEYWDSSFILFDYSISYELACLRVLGDLLLKLDSDRLR